MAERNAELLPVPYFHVVFTLPQQLASLALQNKRVVYGILFRAVSETLLEVAADPQLLGAEIGLLAVLHTWGQSLQHHPHLHCVVPGGGLSPDRARWISSSDHFFLPVKVLSRVFRGKFLALLKRAFRQSQLQFHGRRASLGRKADFNGLLNQMYRREWVVYTKPPFAGPEQVLRYLSRYTYRVAISNHRILSVADGNVTFRWKDYAHGNKKRKMTLTASEFLRRFWSRSSLLTRAIPLLSCRFAPFATLATCKSSSVSRTCYRDAAAWILPDETGHNSTDAKLHPSIPTNRPATRLSDCSTIPSPLVTLELLPGLVSTFEPVPPSSCRPRGPHALEDGPLIRIQNP